MSEIGSLPRITVVTPSFNQGRYLDACIRSVLDQSYPNLEYMVFDGGSTDESVEVIRRHEKQLSFWVSQKDSGQSDAINQGFKKANGQIVAWLNSDDIYLPGALARAAEAYKQAPEASFWYGRCIWVDETGQFKRDYVNASKLLFNRDAMAYGMNYIPQPATFINREYLVKIGFLNPSLRWVLDTDLWLRLSALAAPIAMEHKLAAAREHAQTKTQSGAFVRTEEIRALSEKYTHIPMTPGAMCHFLDDFYKIVLAHPDAFPKEYHTEVTRFWASTSALLAQWGADQEGNPIKAGPMDPQRNIKQQVLKLIGVW